MIYLDNLKEFRSFVIDNAAITSKIVDLKKRIEKFASAFPLPGLEDR